MDGQLASGPSHRSDRAAAVATLRRTAKPAPPNPTKSAWSYYVGKHGDLFYVEPAEILQQRSAVNTIYLNGFTRENIQLEPSASSAIADLHNSSNSQDCGQLKSNGAAANSSNIESQSDVRKTVYLIPSKSICSDDVLSAVELCKALFGIILCSYNPKSATKNGMEETLAQRRLIVQSVIPNSQAQSSGKIHRGDMLVAIDNKQVNWSNLETLLRSILDSEKVKFIFQSPFVVGFKPNKTQKFVYSFRDSFVWAITGDNTEMLSTYLSQHLSHLLCLSLDAVDSDLNADSAEQEIIYQFPQQSSKLSELRGAFLTLNHLLQDMCGKPAKNTSLLCSSQLVHVAYQKEGRCLLILAVPSEILHLVQLNYMMESLLKVLKLLFGDITMPFQHVDFHPQLNQLVALFFHHLLTLSSSTSVENCLSEVRWLPLEEETKLVFDEVLSELESSDFENNECGVFQQRSYMVLGSCVLYKGSVVCSHLMVSDLLDLWLTLKLLCLVSFTQDHTLNELLIWHEVFLTRRSEHEDEDQATQTPLGYMQVDSRCFLLVIGVGQSLLCVLLESGGCTSSAKDHPRPHPVFMDQVKATLLQIEDEGLLDCCEKRMFLENSGCGVMNVDSFLFPSTGKTGKLDPTGSATHSSDGWWEAGPGEKAAACQGCQRFYAPSDSVAGSSSDILKAKASSWSSLFEMSTLNRVLVGLQEAHSREETPRPDNMADVLFHYVLLDKLEGIYISQTEYHLRKSKNVLHHHILGNFRRCCLKIHQLFKQTKKETQKTGTQSPSKSYQGGQLCNVREHAVMFHCHLPSNKKCLTYWVQGRVFPDQLDSELYVCYPDSVPQSMVELAYQLGFGVIT